MELHEKDTIKDVLIKIRNKDTFVLLKSGKEYHGIIKEVGQFCITLEQKGNRSYYDSIIKIEDISAVEIQIRGL